jgi:hypothetical protein
MAKPFAFYRSDNSMWGENLAKKAEVCFCQSYHQNHQRHIYDQTNACISCKITNLLMHAYILLHYLWPF